MQKADYFVAMSDGVEIALRVYTPDGSVEPRPTLFAVSPYRFDNDEVPETHTFLWYEMGPFRWYVEEHDYAFVRADVRGTGRSGGEFGFMNERERRDLYELVEWVAEQPWSTGKIGGIGQSYYAISQWALAAVRPPHLTCLAPYDGCDDVGSSIAHSGGIPSIPFMNAWWTESFRPANESPFSGPPRKLPSDFPYDVAQHDTFDQYWKERTFLDDLAACDIPVYAVGAWSKLDLHTSGVIDGFQRITGVKKLRLASSPNALKEFASIAFHGQVLLPFYDWALKGIETDWLSRPTVEYEIQHDERTRSSRTWPPAEARVESLFLAMGPTNTVTSLNDGRLVDADDRPEGSTSYSYPDREWVLGPIVMQQGVVDRVKRVLTFTSEPLPEDLTIAGPSELVLHLASTRTETEVIVKLAEQLPQSAEQRATGAQPDSIVVTKGWLRSGHRDASGAKRPFGATISLNLELLPLARNEIHELRVPLMAVAHRFAAGSRIRIEISNADSKLTDRQFYHVFTPAQAGTDTIFHALDYPSRLDLLVTGD